MKQIQNLLIAISLAVFFQAKTVNAQTTTPPLSMDVLKAREALLKETTSLNKQKIKLANMVASIPKLEADLSKANERSAKSAIDSKDLAAKMHANAGDQKLAKRASHSAKSSYNDARKAKRLTDQLKSTKQKISSLETDIEKQKAKIAKMDEQLKFTSN